MTTLLRERLPADTSPDRSGALWALVVSGAATLETADDRWTILPGDAVLVDARTAHRITADVETDLVYGDLRRSDPSVAWPSPLVLRGFDDEHRGVVALVTNCPLTVKCRPNPLVEASASLIGAAISTLVRAAEQGGGSGEAGDADHDPQVAAVVAALAERPAEPWTVDRMAALVHLSRSALTDRFRRATGHSPMRLLRAVRMNLARRLLAEQRLAITRVAFEVGYGSVAAFSRAFATDHGVSPLAWRATHDAAGPAPTVPDPSGAGQPHDRPDEARGGRGPRADQQQRPDAVPVQ